MLPGFFTTGIDKGTKLHVYFINRIDNLEEVSL